MTQELNNIFNIGTGIETSVNALAATLLEASDTDCAVIHQPTRTGEQRRSVIDPSLAKKVLGWEPMIPLQDGLGQTLAWFRSRHAVSYQHSARSLGGIRDRERLTADS
jgi:UDP-glucose 4-epimerase